MSEASPLPWRDDGWGIVDVNGRAVPFYGAAPQFAKEQEHRRLIIRSVNSYNTLLAAAKRTASAFCAMESVPYLALLETLETAIAAAEESKP